MSRIAKAPITVPSGVEVAVDAAEVRVKGPNGTLAHRLHADVQLEQDGAELRLSPRDPARPGAWAQAGTARALLSNMVTGVTDGFRRTLDLVGVGYRAQMGGKGLNLTVGFSHPVEMPVPEGLKVETPTQTQIVVTGSDKQRVGQFASEIRAVRPPEPYKGKGIRYSDERVLRKEAKKK